jgi:hypothetical protein
MKRTAMALVVGFFGSLFCLASTHAQPKHLKNKLATYDDHDGYEVLSVLLNAQSDKWKNETITIGPRTALGRAVAEIKAECSGIPAEFQAASEDFDRKVQTRLLLRKGFSLRKNYELGYASSAIAAEQPRNKEEIRKRIRSGTYYVAAVGFDDKRTRAIAFVEYICGSLCGNSLFYYLRKSEKGWEEAREVQREVQTCGRIY